MRRAAKRDLAEPSIIAALRKAGCKVAQLQRPVDLAVLNPVKRIFLLEVKTLGQSDHTKERIEQRKFIDGWDIPIVRTAQEALHAVGIGPATQPRVEGDSPVAAVRAGLPDDFHVTPVYR